MIEIEELLVFVEVMVVEEALKQILSQNSFSCLFDIIILMAC